MKTIMLILSLFSFETFAQQTDWCMGGPYWDLMEKSERICGAQAVSFEQQTGLSCSRRWHNSPNVCWNDCVNGDGSLVARLRVDMTSNCESGQVWFLRTNTTWYR